MISATYILYIYGNIVVLTLHIGSFQLLVCFWDESMCGVSAVLCGGQLAPSTAYACVVACLQCPRLVGVVKP